MRAPIDRHLFGDAGFVFEPPHRTMPPSASKKSVV
jgi:hypothetical protein